MSHSAISSPCSLWIPYTKGYSQFYLSATLNVDKILIDYNNVVGGILNFYRVNALLTIYLVRNSFRMSRQIDRQVVSTHTYKM